MTGFKLQRVVLRYSLDGQSKKDLEEQTGKVALVSESREHEGKLYLGSAFLPQLAIYTITWSDLQGFASALKYITFIFLWRFP